MNLMNKLTIKNLKLNKKRTIVTIIGIILSVALITAVASMVVSARLSLIRFEKESSGDYYFGFSEVPSSDLGYFKNNRNISEYYLTKNVGYAKIDSKNKYKPYAYIMSFGKNALLKSGIVLLEGRMPESEDEILISRHVQTNGDVDYNLGDEVSLEVGDRMSNGYQLNQTNMYIFTEPEAIDIKFTKNYKIVGIIERPSNDIEPHSAPGYTFITLLNDEADGLYKVYTKYTKKGMKDMYRVTANILGIDAELFNETKGGQTFESNDIIKEYLDEMSKAKYSLSTNGMLIKLETMSTDESTMRVLYTLASIVIIIIVVTSVFCIKNSFEISITEKIKQYGMFRSIGATSKQIKKNVFYEAFILGVISIPLGILSGIFAAYVLIKITNYLLAYGLSLSLIFRTSILAVLISVLISAITIYFSARKSAKKAAKVSPIIAIRNADDIKIKRHKIRMPKIVSKIFGIGGTISYKNLKRSRKKYRTTVISIIVCVSVFIGLTAFIDIGFRTIKLNYGETNYNIIMNIKSEQLETRKNEILNDSTIKQVSVVASKAYIIKNPKLTKEFIEMNSTKDENDNIINVPKYDEYMASLVSVGKDEYQRYLNTLGISYDSANDRGILINNTIINVVKDNESKKYEVDYFDYKVSDKINGYVNAFTNDVSKEVDLDLDIIKVTSARPLSLENSFEHPIIIVSDEYMRKIEKPQYVDVFIKSSDPDKLGEKIKESLKGVEYSLTNVARNNRLMSSYYTLIGIFLYGFITVIALIGVTNIFNTITTNMELRSREFAMLKSIGMTRKEFNHMIRLESLFYGTKSLMIGIPIGIGISYLIFNAFTDSSLVVKYSLPIKGIIISIVVVFILTFIIMKYSISRINKKNTIETIRNENI